jgi:Lon protease-like protein
VLPLFPLQVVLFPGQSLPLAVSDRNHLRMVGTCLDRDAPLGVVLATEPDAPHEPVRPCRVGTAARIVDARPAADGSVRLVVTGVRRFEIAALLVGGPWPLAEVTYPDDEPAPADRVELARGLFAEYQRLVARVRPRARHLPRALPPYDGVLAYAIAEEIAASVAERQRLLEGDAPARLEAAIHLLRRELDVLRMMEEDGGLTHPAL